MIGREKDLASSEIPTLIQRSLQLDQERDEISRVLKQYQEEHYPKTLTDESKMNDIEVHK